MTSPLDPSPTDEAAPDAFERGQAGAEAVRRAMDDVREDVAAMVREEVARAGMSSSDLERLVRETVARESRRPAAGGSPAWRTPAVAVAGVVVGLLAGALGYRALQGGGDDAGRPPTVSAPVGAAASAAGTGTGTAAPGPAAGPTAEDAQTPAARAARYDSLFAAGSDRLAPLVDRLEAAGPAAPVRAAIETWRGGGELDEAAARRLHDALVQLALNEEAGTGLTLDGLVSRGPCRGNSCGALLDVWRSRGAELGMPELPADPAGDTPALSVAERVLVLGRLDGGG